MPFNAYTYRANRDALAARRCMAEARVAKAAGDIEGVRRCVRHARLMWRFARTWWAMKEAR